MGLNADTRTKIVDILSENLANSFSDFDRSDFYDIAVRGWKGYESYSDKELVDELRNHVEVELDMDDEDVDPALRALRSLLSTLTSDSDRAEVQKHIDERIKFHPPPPRKEVEPSESKVLLDRAEAELAIHDIVSA